jgi:hypothetical protein
MPWAFPLLRSGRSPCGLGLGLGAGPPNALAARVGRPCALAHHSGPTNAAQKAIVQTSIPACKDSICFFVFSFAISDGPTASGLAAQKQVRIWAPRCCAAAALPLGSAKASVLPALWPSGPGQAALRSGALCRPPWRGADETLPCVNNGKGQFIRVGLFCSFFRHQRRPYSLRIGRLCCPSPASSIRFTIVLPGELTSGPEAVGQPELQARRGFQGCSLQSTFGRGCRGPTLPALTMRRPFLFRRCQPEQIKNIVPQALARSRR